MIVEKITNQMDETALSVSDRGVCVESDGASIHHVFESSIEVIWLIKQLQEVIAIMREVERNEAEL